jgi:hypothetical protein
MSSVSSYSPGTSTIDFIGQGRYRVNTQDRDGDGVVDGKSLAGGDGKVVNEGEVNKILAAHGLKAVNGSFQSVDGFSLSSTNTSAVVTAGGPPVLPDVSGPVASSSSLGSSVDYLGVTQGLQDAALTWMALSEMARTAMRDVKDAKDLKHALQKGKIDSKKAEIKATERRIDAERDEANRAFGYAVAGAVASALLSWAGGSLMGSDTVGGQLTSGLAGGIGNVVTSFGNAQSHNGGPIARKNEAELREKNEQMTQEVMQMAVDEADSNYQEAKELMKLAFKIMGEHVELQSQAVQNITRG